MTMTMMMYTRVDLDLERSIGMKIYRCLRLRLQGNLYKKYLTNFRFLVSVCERVYTFNAVYIHTRWRVIRTKRVLFTHSSHRLPSSRVALVFLPLLLPILFIFETTTTTPRIYYCANEAAESE